MTEAGGPDVRRRNRLKVYTDPMRTLWVPKGEVAEDGPHVIGTFHLPGHHPREVKYHVGRRTITLWSRKEGHEFQTLLVLPRWVRPETYILRHKNGVYEFVLETAPDPPRPLKADPGA
jgi:hypothetical protein